jgi:hypothetical protein
LRTIRTGLWWHLLDFVLGFFGLVERADHGVECGIENNRRTAQGV